MSKLEVLRRNVLEARAEIEALRRRTLDKVFCEFLNENSDIKVVVIKGHTPYFNDGDVCSHSQDVYFNQEYFEEYEDPEEAEEEYGFVLLEDFPWDKWQEERGILDELTDDFEALYGTNFIIKISRNSDGLIETSLDYYEPEY